MVKDIIETRAELYRALHRSPRAESEEEEEEEEEGGGKEAMVNQEDLSLTEHLKLKESFLAGNDISNHQVLADTYCFSYFPLQVNKKQMRPIKTTETNLKR